MIDSLFRVNKVLTELRTLEDLIRFYREGDKEKLLEIADNASTEVAKIKVMLLDGDE